MAFSLFPNLSPELRIQIWNYALLEEKESSEKAVGRCFHLLLTRVKNSPWYSNILDNIQIEIPLAFVNHEARDVALCWIHEQDIKVRANNNTQPYILTCEFDPMCDTLYVPLDKKPDFLNEYRQTTRWRGLGGQGFYYSVRSKLTYIAIPEALLEDADISDEMFQNFFDPKVHFIIANTQPDFEDNGMKVQQQWNLETFQGMCVSWDIEQRKFEWKTGNVIDGDALHKRMEGAIEYIDRTMIEGGIKSFEIPPVFAVKG